MNLQCLLTFAIVAKLKSITRAAEQLNLGQPAVSGQLRLLQDAVGEPLYERIGHQISLTPAGQGLLEYAERMERDYREAKDYIRRLQQVNIGTLRIGSTMTIASYYLPQYVVRLQTAYPGVHVYINTGNTQEIVQNLPELDLAFIEGPVATEQLPAPFRMLPWKEDEIVLIVPRNHEIAEIYPETVPLDVFTRYQIIWREPGSGARQVVETALAEAHITAPVNIEVMGVAGVKESVRAGLGIGFASIQAMRHENKRLVSRRINPPDGLRWQLNIIAPEAKMRSRASRALLDLLIANEGDTRP
ncbi:LysR family transcriptional regulator [Methylocaldum sp.]|uniref:LysR family transcriptional regulator n=1 Tax=Methylocaldum sp. TaxID=1969727 RepID=UPI002D626879|nr:LysR substrate-binding domain-containing protein [Methylocaldum sp.]HYE36040.1 LysR substrate-binding domain-containing protein [Methylocaldum sp.]